MALFEEPSEPFVSSYLKGYTTPGPLEREKSRHAKVSNIYRKLNSMLKNFNEYLIQIPGIIELNVRMDAKK